MENTIGFRISGLGYRDSRVYGGNERLEQMEATRMGYIGVTIRIHSLLPS